MLQLQLQFKINSYVFTATQLRLLFVLNCNSDINLGMDGSIGYTKWTRKGFLGEERHLYKREQVYSLV